MDRFKLESLNDALVDVNWEMCARPIIGGGGNAAIAPGPQNLQKGGGH